MDGSIYEKLYLEVKAMGTYKEEAARREGMSYALGIAKEKGIGALEVLGG